VTVTAPRQRPRTCVACKEESPKRALIRVVRSPCGNVVLDERGKLPGRGAYLCARRECLEKAQKTRALARALKTAIPDELYAQIGEYMGARRERLAPPAARKELQLLLGLARRADLIYIGIDSVKSQGTKGPLLILTAADSSEAVEDAACKEADGPGGHVHFRVPLDAEALSASLGAGGVQAVALPARNGLADKIKLLLGDAGAEGAL
jgi:predicted RNA-binding protein YlxR (DUF448 family)